MPCKVSCNVTHLLQTRCVLFHLHYIPEAKNIDSGDEDDDASQFCPRIDSFIEWNPTKSCINFDQLKKIWTGIMRSREMLETVPGK